MKRGGRVKGYMCIESSTFIPFYSSCARYDECAESTNVIHSMEKSFKWQIMDAQSSRSCVAEVQTV